MKEIKRANDIVSCEKENALYILDIRRAFVWKIEQNSKTNQNEIKWLELPDDFWPETLSMSKIDQLLMVSKEPSPSLRIYGSDAQLRLLINLHQCINYPLRAVETSTGNFVILHAHEKKNESLITTLSRDGKTIVHDYQSANEEQRLSGFDARYLSIDSNDRLFVADYWNDRVIVLDSNLRWNKIVFPKSEGKYEDSGKKTPLYPNRLYYDEEKKQLVVCGSNRVVSVFINKF